MSVKENKELIRRCFKDWNALNGDAAKLRSFFDMYYPPAYVYHSARQDMNREQAIEYFIPLISQAPDANFAIDDQVAEGDEVVTRYTMQYTHNRTVEGIPATGKRISAKGIVIDRIVRGKSQESWEFYDELGVLTQLGAIPSGAPNK